MSVIDDLQNQWNEQKHASTPLPTYDKSALGEIARTRARHQVSRAMHYFWGALTLQIIVYALFSHLWVRSWGDSANQWLCLAGILLYLPFTVMLMKKFKQIARATPNRKQPSDSVHERIQDQYGNLVSFYRFKKRYEYVLIPASTALGIFLLFQLYVPGGLAHALITAAILYGLTLLACGWAIVRENRNQFERPIEGLRQLLNEFDQ